MSFAAYSVEAFAYECAPDPFIIQVNKLMKKMIKTSFDKKRNVHPTLLSSRLFSLNRAIVISEYWFEKWDEDKSVK